MENDLCIGWLYTELFYAIINIPTLFSIFCALYIFNIFKYL